MFLKPDKGSGAVGTRILQIPDDLQDWMFSGDWVVSEYLPGEDSAVSVVSVMPAIEGIIHAPGSKIMKPGFFRKVVIS